MQLPAELQQAYSCIQESATITDSLPEAKKRKMIASETHDQVKDQISSTRAKRNELRANRDTKQEQLRRKERNLDFLTKLLRKKDKKNHDLKDAIAYNEAEIAELNRELDEVKHELCLVKEKNKQLTDELQWVLTELEDRSREVCDLERAKAELESKKSRLYMLVGMFATRCQVSY